MTTLPGPAPALRADRRSRLAWAFVDAAVWAAAVWGAVWLRWLYASEGLTVWGTLVAMVVAAMLHVAVAYVTGPYRRGQIRGSYEEIVALAQAAVTVGALLLVATIGVGSLPKYVPGTVPVVAGAMAMSGMLALRLFWREKLLRTRGRRNADPLVVYGAGSGGRLVVRALVDGSDSPYNPVALIDDDPKKRGLRVHGVKVVGGREDLAKVAAERGARSVILAIPSADAEQMRDLHAVVDECGLKTLVIPPMEELVGERVDARDIRDINLEDLLGRRPVSLDEVAIAEQVSGKVVLVTGAGGSIGSELCRQIARFGVGRLVLLDRDESALHALQIDLDGDGLLQSENIVLADIRDLTTVRQVFGHHRPQVVFHAAALKHLPLLERYPFEAWQSNVVGTLNVLQAAAEVGVETFVNISTDKAASPTSVLGFSKRIAERMTADFSRRHAGRYLSVRFGNVLGSRGSVIPAFQAQIAKGGPVTVTHANVERYFMLIPEACQLVLQAAALGQGGEVMVLDMGKPVKIADVARSLIDLSGRHDIEITYTGLRPGEKLSEDLFAAPAAAKPTSHPLVTHVTADSLPASNVGRLRLRPEACASQMRHLALSPSLEDVVTTQSQAVLQLKQLAEQRSNASPREPGPDQFKLLHLEQG